MQNVLVTLTANIAGPEHYGFSLRRHVAEMVFVDIRAHLIGFQEFTGANMPAFRKVGHLLIRGEEANGVLNAISHDPRRLECDSYGTFWLTEDGKPGIGWDGIAERAVTWARFDDLETKKPLLFVNTQFDNVGVEARKKSMEKVLAFMDQFTDVPQKILSGDLNMSVGSPHPRWQDAALREPYVKALEAGFVDAWTAAKPVRPRPRMFHHFQGPGCGDDEYGTYDTDYTLVRGMHVHNSMLVTTSYGGVMPSDHYWVLTHLGPEET